MSSLDVVTNGTTGDSRSGEARTGEAQPVHPFDADTAARRIADDRFAAEISGRWNTPIGTPNGGYLLAVCVRALQQTLPFPDPLAVSAHYLRPGKPGPVELRAELVRAGRRHATGEARMLQEGKEILRVTGTFTDLAKADGRTVELGAPPDLPDPEGLASVVSGMTIPGATILDQVECRMPEKPGWMLGHPSGDPRWDYWMGFSQPRDPDLVALSFLVDAVAPLVFDIGASSSTTIELTVHLRAHPAPGWLACRGVTRHVTAGYHEEDIEMWDSAGNLVAQSRQLALLG
jgi:acyl-coenzyme A thioesterase PaaI-like protein